MPRDMQNLAQRAKDSAKGMVRLYEQADERTGGSLGVLAVAVRRFNDTHASEAAASMAYYAFFSLFPFFLFLTAAGSVLLESDNAYRQVVAFASRLLPDSGQLIEMNLQQVLRLRGPVGIIGLAGLLWSAMSFFKILANQVNRAWPGAKPRDFLRQSLVALAMVGTLAGLLVLSLLSNGVANLLPRLPSPLLGDVPIYDTPLWMILSGLIPWLFTFLMFLSLYRWVPNTAVKWRGALWGALIASLAWQLAIRGFAWYLGSSLGQYELVYGSLGSVVALLFWIYLSSLITLFGAHLSAAVARTRQLAP